MKLSTRARYGTRILISLALNGGKYSLAQITARERVSRSYVQHLISPLIKAGIVGSTRGTGGGIWLTRPPHQVRLSQVIRLLEGNDLLMDCLSNPGLCPNSPACRTRETWCRVERAMLDVLDKVTLGDLAVSPDERRLPCRAAVEGGRDA